MQSRANSFDWMLFSFPQQIHVTTLSGFHF